jgi:predicted signal transduction protein with EAL and GGDEF domain
MLSESQRSAIIRTAVTGRILARLFLTPNRLELVFAAVLSAGLIAAGAALVFVTGGTKLPYLHTLYLPIFLDSLFFGPVGGAVAGLLAGLSIGPFMPLDVNANVPQEAFGWSFRMGIFTLAGLVVGAVVSALRASMANTVLYGVLDEFTGLPNRQHLIGVLTTRLQSGAGQTVFSINLRSIRPIAIAFGIHTAEILLKRVAERLSVRLRAPDLLFRAESSALAVLSDSPGDFEILAEGLVATLSKPVEVEGVPLMLDASVGVAQAKPEDDPPDLVLRRAALAADDAHESGKPWSRYIRESDEVLRERLLMLGDVRVALDDGELTLAYQPKVRLSSGIMEGCEALVRWTSPARGMVPPDQFVPVVECSALIGSLTQYIFRAAIRQVAEWQGQGERIVVSINMSARDFSAPDVAEATLAIIDEYGVDHALIDVEITESAAFLKDTELSRKMRCLRDAGLTLSIDDYGTGMSSLSYLKRIPARYVKIDQTFVRNIVTSQEDRVLVESTVQMCRRMGLVTVAEGVENQACADMLASMGCDLGQGYLFAPPLPAKDLLAFWRANHSSARQQLKR